MIDRRRLLLASCSAVMAAPVRAASPSSETNDVDELGKFELVRGTRGVVIGVPHATSDAGTADAGRVLCKRLEAGGVFVTGFWDGKTRQRINVNRPTEQVIGQDSQVVRQWPSSRAAAANARYEASVKEVAQGPLRMFYEIHSNSRARLAGSIEVSTLGVSRADAARLRDAFDAARERIARDIPRLDIHVSPLDKVTYPDYGAASSIAKFSAKGCAIEHPGHVFANRAWRLAYANCLADAIKAAQWS